MADQAGEVVSGEAHQQTFATGRPTDQVSEDDQDTHPATAVWLSRRLASSSATSEQVPSTRFASASIPSMGWR